MSPSVAMQHDPSATRTTALWLQGVTLGWMTIELGVSSWAALTAHSPALLAFGADSLVELFSAAVVLLQWMPGAQFSQRRAARAAAVLLFALAIVVAGIGCVSLLVKFRPLPSLLGIAITLAALFAMPLLAALKRREARRLGNAALAADAVQSATCAYLAAIALLGLLLNAWLKIAWFDPVAALAAVPILIQEGRSAWRGKTCACC